MHYVALFTTDYLTTFGFVHFFNSRAGSREEEIDLAHPPLRIFARLFMRRARTRSIRTGWDPVHGTISLWRYSFSDTRHIAFFVPGKMLLLPRPPLTVSWIAKKPLI